MYATLLLIHSFVRWLVLLSLVYALWRAYRGKAGQLAFTDQDNAVRHWTATFAHIQLAIGVILYFKSPLIKSFWDDARAAMPYMELPFFALVHMALMLLAVIIITVGSAKAKRQADDRAKFQTMLVWFSVALLIIFLAIPWPFSPLAQRPYLRLF